MFATANDEGMEILLYCHHDAQWTEREGYTVNIEVSGLVSDNATVDIYQVDEDNCNAHTLWNEMGSPDYPGGNDKQKLIKAGKFKAKSKKESLDICDKSARIQISLPVHAVPLIKIVYKLN